MKAVLALAAAGAAIAQNLSGEPACATSCLVSAISAAGCAASDQACQCGPTQAAIGSLAAPCLIAACPATDLVIAASVGTQLCVEYSKTASVTGGPATGTITSTVSSSSSSSSGSSPTTSFSSTVASSNLTITTKPATSTSTSTSAPASQSTNAAATQAVLGAGAIAALLGAIAAL